MEDYLQGLFSGLEQPFLGFDHLLFVVSVGLAAVCTGYPKSAPLAYVSAIALGCLAGIWGMQLPMVELAIGLTLLVLVSTSLYDLSLKATTAAGLFALFGLFHGSTYGEALSQQDAGAGFLTLFGQHTSILSVQYLVAVLSGTIVARLATSMERRADHARLSSGAVAGTGSCFALEASDEILFDSLGWVI